MTTPDRVGRYRVVRRVGSGGFATVWLARDEVLEAPVAVKVLADNWAHRMDVRARFEEEARILRRADSDRVVRVHDIGELPDGRPYFVMTYADRGTLADRLGDGPYPSAGAFADALDAVGSGPAPAARPRRRLLVAVLVTLLVPAGAGTAAGLLWARRDVAVATADGTIRLRIPHDWARQVRRSGWDLGPYGAPGRSGIALAAAPDVTRWTDPSTGVPGVFAGRADGVAPAALLARSVAASCPATPSRPLARSGLSGTLTRRQCSGAPMAYVEVVLQPPGREFTVYVQVKEQASADTADAVLQSLVVTATGRG